MCEFCIKHGEGKKWYEVMEHYSAHLAEEQRRQAYIQKFVEHTLHHGETTIQRLAWAKRKFPAVYRFIRTIGTAGMKANHYGQIVPLEDVEAILDRVHSITRIACICRSVTTGKHNARYCFLLGLNPEGIVSQWPDVETSLEKVSAEEAKRLVREFDRNGLIHSIWTFKTPFIGAICNCDHDCLAYRVQISGDLINLMFKAEYYAEIAIDQCNGCRNCQRLCQFGAIEYSALNQKCYINIGKCYGCGVCRAACKGQAITLIEKGEVTPK
ncbi:MAG TPA: 4Fe-4S dicluster domain-containing protein [Bacillota bacterium]|nr:4Fe-4S dicluster domain-containing protein [Bacillota bacterium]HPT87239.1 4Fe-4S dicluster domain-containing protein [Bacillota bacterium]